MFGRRKPCAACQALADRMNAVEEALGAVQIPIELLGRITAAEAEAAAILDRISALSARIAKRDRAHQAEANSNGDGSQFEAPQLLTAARDKAELRRMARARGLIS